MRAILVRWDGSSHIREVWVPPPLELRVPLPIRRDFHTYWDDPSPPIRPMVDDIRYRLLPKWGEGQDYYIYSHGILFYEER